jgi:hypothetical protein
MGQGYSAASLPFLVAQVRQGDHAQKEKAAHTLKRLDQYRNCSNGEASNSC